MCTYIIRGLLTRCLFYFECLCLERFCLLASVSTSRIEIFGGRSELDSCGLERGLGLGENCRLPLFIFNSLSMSPQGLAFFLFHYGEFKKTGERFVGELDGGDA